MADFRIVKNKRDEDWLHDSDADVAVPFEMTVCAGEAVIEYYPSAEGIVDEYLRLFGESEQTLLSCGAVDWANRAFEAFLEGFGFLLSPDSNDFYVNYRLRCAPCGKNPAVRRLDGTEGYRDLTDTDVEGLCNSGYIIYAAVEGNNIVAVANTGVPITEDAPREVEIGVDTAEDYRRRGYGRACVCALVNELSSRGHEAIYECASGNTASVGLIESLCGEALYKKLYFVGFRAE